MIITSDSQLVDSRGEGSQGPEEVEDNWVGHMQVDIQQTGDMADRDVTFAGHVAPSLVVGQTFHPACPFQSCVASEKSRPNKQCSKRRNHKLVNVNIMSHLNP